MIEVNITQRTHDMHESRIVTKEAPEFGGRGVFMKSFTGVKHFFPYRNILHITWREKEEE